VKICDDSHASDGDEGDDKGNDKTDDLYDIYGMDTAESPDPTGRLSK